MEPGEKVPSLPDYMARDATATLLWQSKLKNEHNYMNRRQADLESAITDLKTRLTRSENDHGAAKDQLAKLHGENKTLHNKLNTMDHKFDSLLNKFEETMQLNLGTRAVSLEDSIKQCNARLEKHSEQVTSRLDNVKNVQKSHETILACVSDLRAGLKDYESSRRRLEKECDLERSEEIQTQLSALAEEARAQGSDMRSMSDSIAVLQNVSRVLIDAKGRLNTELFDKVDEQSKRISSQEELIASLRRENTALAQAKQRLESDKVKLQKTSSDGATDSLSKPGGRGRWSGSGADRDIISAGRLLEGRSSRSSLPAKGPPPSKKRKTSSDDFSPIPPRAPRMQIAPHGPVGTRLPTKSAFRPNVLQRAVQDTASRRLVRASSSSRAKTTISRTLDNIADTESQTQSGDFTGDHSIDKPDQDLTGKRNQTAILSQSMRLTISDSELSELSDAPETELSELSEMSEDDLDRLLPKSTAQNHAASRPDPVQSKRLLTKETQPPISQEVPPRPHKGKSQRLSGLDPVDKARETGRTKLSSPLRSASVTSIKQEAGQKRASGKRATHRTGEGDLDMDDTQWLVPSSDEGS